MANATTDVVRAYEYTEDPVFNDLPVAAGTNGLLYEGTFVAAGGSTGATMISGTNDTFAGICAKKVDNTGGAALALNVHLRSLAYPIMTVVGAASGTAVGQAVYGSDNQTATLTPGSNLQVGKVHRWISGTTCVVKCEALSVRSI
jgi:hypothetical protein